MSDKKELQSVGDGERVSVLEGAAERPWSLPGEFPLWGHVVSIATHGVVSGWRHKKKRIRGVYFKCLKNGALLKEFQKIKKGEDFENEYAAIPKTFTGILFQLDKGDNQDIYVLTAGHPFHGEDGKQTEEYRYTLYDLKKEENPPEDQQGEWWDSSSFILRGETLYSTYGGTLSPDFTLIKLSQKSSIKVRGYCPLDSWGTGVSEVEGMVGSSKKELQFLYFMHPRGLSLKKVEQTVKTSDSSLNALDIWKTSPYFFAPLKVSSGCSGSPVFLKGEEGILVLFGIVVGKGNSFYDFDKSGKWRFPGDGEKENGAKILTFAGVVKHLERLENSGYPKLGMYQSTKEELRTIYLGLKNKFQAPRVARDWSIEFRNKTEETQSGILRNNHALEVVDDPTDGLELKYTGTTSGENWSLDITSASAITLRFLSDSLGAFTRFEAFQGMSLEGFSEDLGDEDNWKVGISHWPIAGIPSEYEKKGNGQLGLRFRVSPKIYECPVFSPGAEVVVLEGIGTMDIIDELPENNCQHLQKIWVGDGFYIELSLTGEKVKIRYPDGLVDVHSRAFKLPQPPSDEEDQEGE